MVGENDLEELVSVPGPHAGAKTEDGVVGDGHGLRRVLETRGAHHRAEDLLLKHSHLVVPAEDSRLHIVPAKHCK